MSDYFDISHYNLAAACKAKGIPVVGSSVDPAFVWIDIETTGLDRRRDAMLELGVVLTNAYGEVIDNSAFQAYVGGDRDLTADLLRDEANEFVQKMHDNSELWADLQAAMDDDLAMSLDDIEEALIEHFEDRGMEWGEFSITGSSVDFDRAFVDRSMPNLVNLAKSGEQFFHYRLADISSIKVFASKLNPSVVDERPKAYAKHRVMPDILDSIAEYRHYINEFLYTERNAEAVSGK